MTLEQQKEYFTLLDRIAERLDGGGMSAPLVKETATWNDRDNALKGAWHVATSD